MKIYLLIVFLFFEMRSIANGDAIVNLIDNLNQANRTSPAKSSKIILINWMGNGYSIGENKNVMTIDKIVNHLSRMANEKGDKSLIIVVRDLNAKEPLNFEAIVREINENILECVVILYDPNE